MAVGTGKTLENYRYENDRLRDRLSTRRDDNLALRADKHALRQRVNEVGPGGRGRELRGDAGRGGRAGPGPAGDASRASKVLERRLIPRPDEEAASRRFQDSDGLAQPGRACGRADASGGAGQ